MPPAPARLLAMSATGRFVALRHPDHLEILDVQGPAPRRTLALDAHADFAICGTTLCAADAEGLRTLRLEGGTAARLAIEPGVIRPFAGRAADAIVVGDALVTLEPRLVERAGATATWFPLHGRAVLAVDGGRACVVTAGRASADFAVAGEVRSAAPLFGGRVIALLVAHGGAHHVLVVQPTGALVHRIPVPAAHWHAFAVAKGQLLLGDGGEEVVAVDLRFGEVSAHGHAPHPVSAAAVDEDGRAVALASRGEAGVGVVSVVRVDELFGPRHVATAMAPAAMAPAPLPDPEPPPPRDVPEPPAPTVEISDALPVALGAPPPVMHDVPATDAPAFADAREHLAALLELVTLHARAAIAQAWNTGRISADRIDQLPFEHEVNALAGESSGLAPDHVATATAALQAASDLVTARTLATMHAGIELPFVSVARELALSSVASQILAVVLGPHARPELARLYRILTNETGRAVCDDALVCQLVAGADRARRDQVLDELAADATLFRVHALHRTANGIEVEPALVARLRRAPLPTTPATVRRGATRALDELVVDRGVLARLAASLATPAAQPLRLVVRGRTGSGRHTIVAAFAARVGREIACIDATQLPRATLVDALARELGQALVTRAVPVISGLELAADADADATQRTRQLLARHPGPLVIRTRVDASLPLEPGFLDVTLPALAESQRAIAFAAALAEAGLAADAAALARRYRVGPGTMHRIARDAKARGASTTAEIDDIARQHVATRIGTAAHRVTRLPNWEDVALPEDMLDSLRELVGRARHARTVYEDWGYDARITTARGLTALFYGPPGTGKTMVAGLVARELGLELYRIDLSKVMSKWIGETEKNLGAVFDAAEDGQLMLLFDEADSLFAKRTEVKSSNDRYANLEVNYLLQRLDSFEGIAIMTTNLEGSIDPAFKRRLSMRLYFPFPDEDMRARLWETHVMPRIPIAGTLDFAALARRFPLSGGYIRNSALRAAFLAAQEQTALTHAHLERAVLLEYRELGKLAESGRME